MQLHDFTDIHHHGPVDAAALNSTIACLSPLSTDNVPHYGYYSVGIHPWDTVDIDRDVLDKVRLLALQPNVVAIGETGIDTLRGAPLDRQIEIFKEHVNISEMTHKPLIIHAVHSFDHIINLHKSLKPAQLWVIHGFRGKPQLASQLLKHGIALSYGKNFNQLSYDITPPHMRFHETD